MVGAWFAASVTYVNPMSNKYAILSMALPKERIANYTYF
jgi:hypothetical protein